MWLLPLVRHANPGCTVLRPNSTAFHSCGDILDGPPPPFILLDAAGRCWENHLPRHAWVVSQQLPTHRVCVMSSVTLWQVALGTKKGERESLKIKMADRSSMQSSRGARRHSHGGGNSVMSSIKEEKDVSNYRPRVRKWLT